MSTDHEHLAALRAALEKMTPRPWHTETAHPDVIFGFASDGMQVMVADDGSNLLSEDRDVVVALVNAADWLLRCAEVVLAVNEAITAHDEKAVGMGMIHHGQDGGCFCPGWKQIRAAISAREAQRGTQEEEP